MTGTPCTDPTHRRKKTNGPGRCLTCRNSRAQARRMQRRLAERSELPLIRSGESIMSATTRAAWVVRKERHGPSGTTKPYTDERREKMRKALRQTVCKRGHKLEGENVYVYPSGDRQCKVCNRDRARCAKQGKAFTRRPAWAVTSHGVRVCIETHDIWCITEANRLWSEVAQSHPDKTGKRTSGEFRKARKRWEQFLANEREWYRIAGVSLPSGLKRSSAVAV